MLLRNKTKSLRDKQGIPQRQVAAYLENDTKTPKQDDDAHLGFWGSLCALFLGHKVGEKLSGGENTHDYDFGKSPIDNFDQDANDYIVEEEEEEY